MCKLLIANVYPFIIFCIFEEDFFCQVKRKYLSDGGKTELQRAKLAAILFLVTPSQNHDGVFDKLMTENLIKRYLRHVALMKKHTLCAGGPGLLHFSQVCVTENNLFAVFTAWCLGQNCAGWTESD